MKSDRDGLPSIFEEKKNEGQSLIVWFFVITLAVSSGNLLSTFITAKAIEWQLAMAADKARVNMEYETARMKAEAEAAKVRRAIADRERAKIQATENERRSAADNQRRNAFRQASETCEFWTSAWREERNSYNKRMMDESCALAKSLR